MIKKEMKNKEKKIVENVKNLIFKYHFRYFKSIRQHTHTYTQLFISAKAFLSVTHHES